MVQICPGVHLAGRVRCANDAFVGTGAAIVPEVEIGSHAVVSAGAVDIENVLPDITVAGKSSTPFRPSR